MKALSVKELTIDELYSLKREISREIDERGREKRKVVFKVGIAGAGATYYKDFAEAKKELLSEADLDSIKNLSNTVFIEPAHIPETEYNLRPDEWYEG